MFSRRFWLSAAASLAGCFVLDRASAAQPIEVVVGTNAVGAIVAAEGGAAVAVVLDPNLGADKVRIAGTPHALVGRLDDPRNAPKLGASVSRLIGAAHPELAAQLESNHKSWTRPFVRKVLEWNARLARTSVRGKRIAAPERAALLEWAGAVVDAKGERPPAALLRAPRDAAAPTLESYVAYVDALVASLA